jgi:hypothetical protein
MIFEWNESKRLSNLRKHGIDFRDAAGVFAGPTLTAEDHRFPYAERRFLTLGLLRGTVVMIVHTEREDAIRVISMREVSHGEAETFFNQIPD